MEYRLLKRKIEMVISMGPGVELSPPHIVSEQTSWSCNLLSFSSRANFPYFFLVLGTQLFTLTALLVQEEIRRPGLYTRSSEVISNHEPYLGTPLPLPQETHYTSMSVNYKLDFGLTLSLDITRNKGGVPILISPKDYWVPYKNLFTSTSKFQANGASYQRNPPAAGNLAVIYGWVTILLHKARTTYLFTVPQSEGWTKVEYF